MRIRKPSRRATVAAVILAALAGQAGAVDLMPDCTHLEPLDPATIRFGGDRVLLAADGPALVLCYENDAAQTSVRGEKEITLNDLTVLVKLQIAGEERITLTPPPGYVVWPADYGITDVPDGAALTVQIFSGLM